MYNISKIYTEICEDLYMYVLQICKLAFLFDLSNECMQLHYGVICLSII